MRNEIKIRFEEPKYEVNLEKGTVECFLKYEVLYPELLQGMFFWAEKIYFYAHGVAKVNSGDVFDENIGRLLCFLERWQKGKIGIYDTRNRASPIVGACGYIPTFL